MLFLEDCCQLYGLITDTGGNDPKPNKSIIEWFRYPKFMQCFKNGWLWLLENPEIIHSEGYSPSYFKFGGVPNIETIQFIPFAQSIIKQGKNISINKNGEHSNADRYPKMIFLSTFRQEAFQQIEAAQTMHCEFLGCNIVDSFLPFLFQKKRLRAFGNQCPEKKKL